MTNLFHVKCWLAIICISLMGCSNTVTLKEEAGTEINISITFESAPNFISYDYFIVYSDTDFNINSSLTNNYFFIPGESYSEVSETVIDQSGGLNNAYDTYFDTWDGVLQLNESNLDQTAGAFSSDIDTESNHINYTSEELSIPDYTVKNNTISFTINVSELSLSTTELIIALVVRTNTSSTDTNALNVTDLAETIEISLVSNQPAVTGDNSSSLFSGSNSGKINSWSIIVY